MNGYIFCFLVPRINSHQKAHALELKAIRVFFYFFYFNFLYSNKKKLEKSQNKNKKIKKNKYIYCKNRLTANNDTKNVEFFALENVGITTYTHV